ncbi:sulfurtransferase [Brevibacillus sp. H7]|uniref:sulfurtransferase n=1 Tax=Brevibacillus sp. H7 TaxID=3349138 RepID=UPI003818A927
MEQLLVSSDWLYDHLRDSNIVIVDCRFVLGKPAQGYDEYMEGHIPGALYFHLEHDLSGRKGEHGGRHPLPETDALVSLFSQAGIDSETTVIAYDDQDLAMASRLWWLLRYHGHQKAAVLNGGFAAWKAAGYPVTQEIPSPTARSFVSRLQRDMLVTIDQVKERGANTVLIDSRAGERYRGEQETIDPKAGHIPGALHYFFKDNLAQDGSMLPKEQLKQRFAPIARHDEIIVYCGSGVTACVNLLALHQAGRTDAKLYPGSWSDWCSYDLPVATGPTPAGVTNE